ncbi:MAG: hypothetical protein EZS28_003677 [Streblomastix strix]|uniref:Uncharacterized protein n=1 Tax=Streblomastix strix TaxID=222440 RepID=A0A5J4X0A2_9EUKA|nr:MAG: hypothetical protein EZS28_003677 [Streblomastix strix]
MWTFSDKTDMPGQYFETGHHYISENILTEIYNRHIAVRISGRLEAQPTFSYKEQILNLWRELKEIPEISVSYRMLESLFGMKKSKLNEIMLKSRKHERDIPNRRRFTDMDEMVIHAQIVENFTSGKPLTYSSFIEFVLNEYVCIIGRAFVNSFLKHYDNQVAQKWCRPREHDRMEVSRDDVQRYSYDLEVHVVGKPTCAILDVDQSGCQY